MFDFVRNNTRILQGILVLLILPSFVLFGIEGYSSFMDKDGEVAAVGRQKINKVEWDNAHRQLVERAQAQQPDVDLALLDSPAARRESLEAVVRQVVLARAAQDQRLVVPPSRVVRVFQTDPQFAALRNPDGTPNKALLDAQGMSSAQLEAMLRQELVLGQVLGGVSKTAFAPATSNRTAVDALFQVREVQWLRLDPKAYTAGLAPTDAQLKAFYDAPANANWLMAPEQADVEYVVLDLDALKQGVSVSEDELRTSYEQNKARFTAAEERRASHILIMAAASASAEQKAAARKKAEGILAEVRKNPAAFAELARKHSEDPGSAANGGDLEFFGRGDMTPPFDAAVFKLKQGEISDLIETDFGFHIIQVTGVRGGEVRPFESVKTELEDEARRQLAQRQYIDAAERFTNMVFEQSDSLKPVAQELKLTVKTAQGVLRQPAQGDTSVLANRRLLEALFDATNRSKGRNTEAIEVGTNQMVSARVVQYRPAAKRPLESVKAELTERWILAEALKRAQADAKQRMEQGQAKPEAAGLPAPVQMSRRTMFSQPPAVLDEALRQPANKLPSWSVVDLGADGVVLMRVNKVLPLEISPQELRETRNQFGSYWAKAEEDAYYRALKRAQKVRFLNDGAKVMDATKADSQQAAASAASR